MLDQSAAQALQSRSRLPSRSAVASNFFNEVKDQMPVQQFRWEILPKVLWLWRREQAQSP
jgi:hypothetical protein